MGICTDEEAQQPPQPGTYCIHTKGRAAGPVELTTGLPWPLWASSAHTMGCPGHWPVGQSQRCFCRVRETDLLQHLPARQPQGAGAGCTLPTQTRKTK